MSPMDPLFVTDCYEAFSRQYFLDKLKLILQLCGYDPTLYNGHSFRSGAAISAGKALVEDHMIKILGRWSSDSYCRYVKACPTIKLAQQRMTGIIGHYYVFCAFGIQLVLFCFCISSYVLIYSICIIIFLLIVDEL